MKICLTGDRAPRLRDEVRGLLEYLGREAEVVVLDADGHFDADARGIEVVFFPMSVTKSPAAMARLMPLFDEPALRWMQGPGAGIDHPIWAGLLERGVSLTNASGIHSEPIAQYIFTYVLHWERNVAEHQRQEAARHWEIIHLSLIHI